MWTPKRIKALRSKYGEVQSVFCCRLGVSVSAVRDWEQGIVVPSGPAVLLLDRLEEDLEIGKKRELQPA